ncbi:hypothetical protein [Pseudoalteromonas aurantia]|uniref:Orphan protein n=1 Tax=Pseudoalteromonas aurantia 208 TaxID=1314867 RepID=A0ABR9EBP4_9GAMM|nr:hypothetical protein [Pseudoalteromonas aurantia]MBE0367789.1 hypothetical protein [Pseudoalteromonas aurantia 208]
MKFTAVWLLALSINVFALESNESNYKNNDLAINNSPQAITGDFDWYRANSASCRTIRSMIFHRHPGTEHLTPVAVPVIYTGGNCWAAGRTTSTDAPKVMYDEVSDIIRRQFATVEHNFKEVSTDIVNNIAAQSDMSIRSHSAYIEDSMTLKINGQVDAQGNVPVSIEGFDVIAKSKLRKTQLGLRIYLHVEIKYADVRITGKYNVHTQQMVLNPQLSNFRPDVKTEVDLPWIIDLINDLTPEIFNQLYTEFSRMVIDVFEFVGVDMSIEVKEVIKHNVKFISQSIVPIRELDNRRAGDSIRLEMEFKRGYLKVKDSNTSYMMFALPMLP